MPQAAVIDDKMKYSLVLIYCKLLPLPSVDTVCNVNSDCQRWLLYTLCVLPNVSLTQWCAVWRPCLPWLSALIVSGAVISQFWAISVPEKARSGRVCRNLLWPSGSIHIMHLVAQCLLCRTFYFLDIYPLDLSVDKRYPQK